MRHPPLGERGSTTPTGRVAGGCWRRGWPTVLANPVGEPCRRILLADGADQAQRPTDFKLSARWAGAVKGRPRAGPNQTQPDSIPTRLDSTRLEAPFMALLELNQA